MFLTQLNVQVWKMSENIVLHFFLVGHSLQTELLINSNWLNKIVLLLLLLVL